MPDPRTTAHDPASLLRERLAHDRADGRPFAEAWPTAVRVAVRDEAEAVVWRAVFSAHRDVWESAYARVSPVPEPSWARALMPEEAA